MIDIIDDMDIFPFPVMPQELPKYDDFWVTISHEIRSRYPDIRELVLEFWRQDMPAESIVKIAGISFQQLEAIVPKSMWLALEWRPCPKCNGKGGGLHTILWSKRKNQ